MLKILSAILGLWKLVRALMKSVFAGKGLQKALQAPGPISGYYIPCPPATAFLSILDTSKAFTQPFRYFHLPPASVLVS
ncbi:hypothetical protein BDP27DRAFT_840209 [Rhodocollybia butyracea]|uniref:Uncharacterized protein n=1 Tax=Rhodocollybia butyracea TaxID=206335 RepID=A0A9P5U6V2_9AGAR|nr:hypothetical protein BDP27DRAFT_840209 [Rhodocollybia butyracea]